MRAAESFLRQPAGRKCSLKSISKYLRRVNKRPHTKSKIHKTARRKAKNPGCIFSRDFGAEDRDRTGTDFTPQDFKSCASACSATPARGDIRTFKSHADTAAR